eukprot:scaffold309726_cov30-Tisochrysis_lutea.AAC.2
MKSALITRKRKPLCAYSTLVRFVSASPHILASSTRRSWASRVAVDRSCLGAQRRLGDEQVGRSVERKDEACRRGVAGGRASSRLRQCSDAGDGFSAGWQGAPLKNHVNLYPKSRMSIVYWRRMRTPTCVQSEFG